MAVLVADDSPVARAAVKTRLRAIGLTSVIEVGSSAAAVAVDPAALEAAVIDLDLGDGNGVDVAAAFHVIVPGLPVAFFSSGATAELLARARAMGPVFEKPHDLDAVVAWVAKVVGP